MEKIMILITKEQIDVASEWREEAFWSLADIEDEINELKWKIENEFKKGSQSEKDAKSKLHEMQPEFNKALREFRMAQWNIEKLHMLIEISE
jgi:hypothetical protein